MSLKDEMERGVQEADDRRRMDIETARLLQDIRDINDAGLEGKKVNEIYLLKDRASGGHRIHVTYVKPTHCLQMKYRPAEGEISSRGFSHKHFTPGSLEEMLRAYLMELCGENEKPLSGRTVALIEQSANELNRLHGVEQGCKDWHQGSRP